MFTNRWKGLQPGVSTFREVFNVLGVPEREWPDATYGTVEHLRLMTWDSLVASVFIKADRVALIVAMARCGGDFPIVFERWVEAFGKPPLRLRSRRSKSSRLAVYAERGLAATVETGGRVSLVEVFPPMAPDAYQRLLYTAPPSFDR